MKKLIIFAVIGVAVAFVAFCVMFLFALQEGPSIDTLTKRVCNSLKVAPESLRFIGGRICRDPHAFFELSAKIPENADIIPLKGCAKEHNAKLFNRLASIHHISYSVRDETELLNYKGDVFDLSLTKTEKGYCILYFGF